MERLLIENQVKPDLYGVRELRHLLDQVVQACIPDRDLHRRMLLCLSEAATNLVQHGGTGVNSIGLRFGRNKTDWKLELLDDGPAWDSDLAPIPSADVALPADTEPAENGRGLGLLHSQSDRIEYIPGNTDRFNRLCISWQTIQHPLRPTILLVEDNPSLRRMYCAYLAADYQVIGATDGAEAIERIAEGKIDLVLSDIRMPNMDGLDLRTHLSQDKETELIPFVFLTAADEELIRQQAVQLGIDDYLIKPVDKSKLLHTLNRVLGRSRQVYRQLTDRVNQRISSALAPSLPQTAMDWRLCAANRNTGIGGGDLLLHQVGENNLMLVLVDIMGHDEEAKFFAYAYGGYLRGLMRAENADSPPSQLMESLSECAFQDELLSHTTLTSCAALLGPDGRVCLASAGHPPPLLIGENGVTKLSVGGILPGLLPDASYQSEVLRLNPGERLALYTDGLFESASGDGGCMVLERDIRQALWDTRLCPMQEALDQVMEVFDRMAATPPRDDTTLLLIEPTA